MEQLGKFLVTIGLALAGMGVLAILLSRVPGVKIGQLPGDIVIRRPFATFYFPLTSMILLSAVLSAAMWIVGRWRR